MKKRLSKSDSYSHYLNEINRIILKNEGKGIPSKTITPLTERQYELAHMAQVNAAKMSGQHHPGNARIAEKIARESAYEASFKQTKLWQSAMEELGESNIPSRAHMRYHGMPQSLKDAIEDIKDNNPNLSSKALRALIATQIFGSL